MGFKGGYHAFLEKLYKKFSLKTKIIIFCILSIVVAIIAVNNAISSRNNDSLKYSYSKNNNETIKQYNSSTKNDESNNSNLQNSKQKKLELEYKEAETLFRKKQYSNSINKANEIIKEDGSFYKAYNIKGIALCYSNNYEDGMKNIDKCLQLKPDYGYGRFNKALAYELYGNYDDAISWYDKDLELEQYVWSYYGKASIYGRRGDIKNTIKNLKIALNISPEIKSIIREEKDFDPVKDSKEFQDLIK